MTRLFTPALILPALLCLSACNPGSGTTAAVVKPDSAPASSEAPVQEAAKTAPAKTGGSEPDCN